MKQPDVAVIDYGMGNLLSVRRGLERCGAEVTVTSDPAEILSTPRVLLPGVGAFAVAMEELCHRDLDEVVREVASQGKPLLGICLGMQMLVDQSEEFGITAGLGLLSGDVVPIPKESTEGQPTKVPHIGWNSLIPPQDRDWHGTVLQKLQPQNAVYFVHSYMVRLTEPGDQIASCLFEGHSVAAVIGKDNIHGCQFHPEKSGEIGLDVLRQFLLL
jgi:imidazole glycerol-phosphate synthase subunit HisH